MTFEYQDDRIGVEQNDDGKEGSLIAAATRPVRFAKSDGENYDDGLQSDRQAVQER